MKKNESQIAMSQRLYFSFFQIDCPENRATIRTHLESLTNSFVPQSLLPPDYTLPELEMGFAQVEGRTRIILTLQQESYLHNIFEQGRKKSCIETKLSSCP